MTIVVFGADGSRAKHLRVSGSVLVAVLFVAASALCSAAWIGWKIGELTASL
jgi:hypothetical protein